MILPRLLPRVLVGFLKMGVLNTLNVSNLQVRALPSARRDSDALLNSVFAIIRRAQMDLNGEFAAFVCASECSENICLSHGKRLVCAITASALWEGFPNTPGRRR